jgi:hypothetical protein
MKDGFLPEPAVEVSYNSRNVPPSMTDRFTLQTCPLRLFDVLLLLWWMWPILEREVRCAVRHPTLQYFISYSNRLPWSHQENHSNTSTITSWLSAVFSKIIWDLEQIQINELLARIPFFSREEDKALSIIFYMAPTIYFELMCIMMVIWTWHNCIQRHGIIGKMVKCIMFGASILCCSIS